MELLNPPRGGDVHGVARLGLVGLALALAACGSGDGGRSGGESAETDSLRALADFEPRTYERAFVFMAEIGDTALVVPWLFETVTYPSRVRREVRAWLARGPTWDAFHQHEFDGPPNRAPWRILPDGPLRVVVGEEDAVQSLVYEEGRRSLELGLGEVRVEWSGSSGEVFRLLDAWVRISDQRIAGFALDASRARSSDAEPRGDWALLASGDGLQVLLDRPRRGEPGEEGAWRGWGLLDGRDLQWPAVTVTWDAVQAFQPARRDVPSAWTVTSPGRELVGNLEVVTARLEAGEGTGPLLPVDGWLAVTGTLRIDGVEHDVRGLFRHTRP